MNFEYFEQVCFVICPIGEGGSEVRKRSDHILNYVIAPALKDLKLTPVRADQISHAGLISAEIVRHIVHSRMVVADLTGQNPNVFYELAIRHCYKKPCIQIVEKGQSIPFDLSGVRTIMIDWRDLESADSAKNEISRCLTAFEESEDSWINNPVSMAVDLDVLRGSDRPQERQMADVVSAVTSEFRGALAALEDEIKSLKLSAALDPLSRQINEIAGSLTIMNREQHSHINAIAGNAIEKLLSNKDIFPNDFSSDLRIYTITALLRRQPFEARDRIRRMASRDAAKAMEIVNSVQEALESIK